MSEIEELPQETQILMIRALKILQTESKARTAPSNHMVPATKVASADSNRALSIAGFFKGAYLKFKPASVQKIRAMLLLYVPISNIDLKFGL